MRVALMVPCYIDMLYPEVGVATLELLEKFGVEDVAGDFEVGGPVAPAKHSRAAIKIMSATDCGCLRRGSRRRCR